MCLQTKMKTPVVTEEDIHVYKVVCKSKEDGLVSPYEYAPVKLYTILKTGIQTCSHDNQVIFGFHSLLYLTKALSELKYFESSYLSCHINNRYYIYKCIIPKGSLYYLGEFERSPGYCSDKIIYKRRLTKKELENE
jgi:hypothetical protein